MPEETWAEHYENHDLLRLDCSRYIWPKLSFIRKCATLSNFGIEKKMLIEKNTLKNIQSTDRNDTDSYTKRELNIMSEIKNQRRT